MIIVLLSFSLIIKFYAFLALSSVFLSPSIFTTYYTKTSPHLLDIFFADIRKSARVRAKLNKNCAVRIEAKLTYCRRILLQQKFDSMLERLKKMKEDGVFELSVPVPKKSTTEIMQEAHRVRCVGGGRSPGSDDVRSALTGKGVQSQVHEEGHRRRG